MIDLFLSGKCIAICEIINDTFDGLWMVAEDDKFIGKERLQELVDEYNKKLEEIREGKEKDIMTV